MEPVLSPRDRLHLTIQRQASYFFFPLLAIGALVWLKGVWRLSLRDPSGVRSRFARIVDGHRPPLLVCSNHLTLVDSMILAWSLSPVRGYLLRFSSLPWNVPEKANFSGTLFWNVTAFLGKCVYVTRGGPREEVRHTLLKLAHLLQAGELVSIFPEGGRSRTGRVDTENFGYGVGQLLQAVPGAEVLCVYLRGKSQGGHSDYPERGDEYEVRLERFRPRTEQGGLRGARDLATQVIEKLAEMESQYFADRQ